MSHTKSFRLLQRVFPCAACVCALLLLGLAAAADAGSLTDWTNGSLSYNSGPDDMASQTNPDNEGFQLTVDSGSCGYGNVDPRMWPFYNVVGLHPTNPIVRSRPQGACGSCLEIQCADPRNICYPAFQPTIALVTNECNDGCNATNINIHALAFEKLAPLKYGRLDVRYRLVECNAPQNISIRVTDYRASQGGWIRLALFDVAGDAGIVAVELAKAPQQGDQSVEALQALPWRKMSNTFGAVWELNGLPTPPLSLRATNTMGQQVIITSAILTAGATGEVESTVQFPASSKAAPATAAPADNTVPATPAGFKPPTRRPGAKGATTTPAATPGSVPAVPATTAPAGSQQYTCSCSPPATGTAVGSLGDSTLMLGTKQLSCNCTLLEAPSSGGSARRMLSRQERLFW